MGRNLKEFQKSKPTTRVVGFRVPIDLANLMLKRAGEIGASSLAEYCALVIESDCDPENAELSRPNVQPPSNEYAELYTRAQEAIEGLTDYRDFLQGKMMAMAEVMREQTEELKRLKKESDNRLFGFDVKTDFQQFATGDEVHTRDDGNERDTDWMSTDEIMDNLTK